MTTATGTAGDQPTLAPTAAQRAAHERWLLEVASLPTASGKEHRVVAWIERWLADRPELTLTADSAGNLTIADRNASAARAPLYITAHLDHPAFVVERFIGAHTVELSFRGGVMDPYFKEARIRLHTERGPIVPATVRETRTGTPFRACIAELEGSDISAVAIGDTGVWDLPPASIEGGLAHCPGCDDLAAAAAALAVLDVLAGDPARAHTRVLFTRAEEIGFVGAIAACRERTIPDGARVIALENSRSFAESPIGGGPIVRVGDRISVFHPGITAACSTIAERLEQRRAKTDSAFKWQRKLMAGGACEASVFCAFGHAATCICLPLGNYHNMADLDRVQAGNPEAVAGARVAREFISVSDYHGMIDLLAACARELEDAQPLRARFDTMYADRAFVLK